MTRTFVATYSLNRIDLACRYFLGSDSDATRRAFIWANFDALRASPTFWLKIGREYNLPERGFDV